MKKKESLMFRAIEGAVMNTAHHHPEWGLTRGMAKSIAKRAVGTLTALGPAVLAAAQSSEQSSSGQQAGTATGRGLTVT